MAFIKPDENAIKTALSISELTFIASGGFKGVYRVAINGGGASALI